MKFKVTHFVRKSSQLKASFIYNQIVNHINYKPNIVVKNEGTKKDTDFIADEINGVEHLKLFLPKSFLNKLGYLILKLISFKDAERIKEFAKNSDILHFHYGTDAGLFLPRLRRIKKPKIVSFYGYDCSGFPRYMFGLGKIFLKNRVFAQADIILAMSQDMKKDLINLGCPEAKIFVHYHGIPLQKFYIERNFRTKSTNEMVEFIVISGFTPQKGHIFLLESFKKALQTKNNIRLRIVGEGPTKMQITEFISINKLGEKVIVEEKTVYASNEHLNYLSNADVFIHPSITDALNNKEGIPGAIVEAMASGLPIISTIHAGIPEVLQKSYSGLLVEENDVDNLAVAIVTIASDSELRKKFGKNAQKDAMLQLDLMIKEKELEMIYESIRKKCAE